MSTEGEAWTLRLLGNVVRLERAGRDVAPEQRTAILLALLAIDGPLSRERAAALLWPDKPADRARGNLRQLLYRLRSDADVVDGDPLALRPGVRTDIDAAVDALDPFAPAWTILDGHDFDDGGELAERFAHARANLRTRLRDLLSARMDAAARSGADLVAAEAAARLAALDPLDERALQLAMRHLIATDHPSRALHLFVRSKDALERMLAVEPSEETLVWARRATEAAAQPLAGAGAVLSGDAPGERSPALGRDGGFVRRAEARGWLVEGAALLHASATSLPSGADQARAWVQWAWLEHQLGHHQIAETAAHRGLRQLPDDAGGSTRIEAWFVLGSIARYRGDLEAANAWWRRALDLAAQGSASGDELALRVNLGMVEDSLGNVDVALEHYLAALPVAAARTDDATTALLLNNIGHVLLGRGDVAEARTLLLRAAAGASASGDRRLRAYALEGLARSDLARGDPDSARSVAATALAIANEIGDPVLRVESAVTFAEAEAQLERVESAIATTRAALLVARRHGNLPGSMRAAVQLAGLLGAGDDLSQRTVRHLALDPRTGAETRRAAAELAAAWGVPLQEEAPDSEFAWSEDAWSALAEALVTPR